MGSSAVKLQVMILLTATGAGGNARAAPWRPAPAGPDIPPLAHNATPRPRMPPRRALAPDPRAPLASLPPPITPPGLVKLFKGHIPELLRHPHGCDVVTDLYDVATTRQRNAMVAEFYGRRAPLAAAGTAAAAAAVALRRRPLAPAPVAPSATRPPARAGHLTPQLPPAPPPAPLPPGSSACLAACRSRARTSRTWRTCCATRPSPSARLSSSTSAASCCPSWRRRSCTRP